MLSFTKVDLYAKYHLTLKRNINEYSFICSLREVYEADLKNKNPISTNRCKWCSYLERCFNCSQICKAVQTKTYIYENSFGDNIIDIDNKFYICSNKANSIHLISFRNSNIIYDLKMYISVQRVYRFAHTLDIEGNFLINYKHNSELMNDYFNYIIEIFMVMGCVILPELNKYIILLYHEIEPTSW